MPNKRELAVTETSPSRLHSGWWSHDLKRTIGEGDIAASYSADRIGMGKPIRRPFLHEGVRWVCVGRRGDHEATAYRLIHKAQFEGVSMSYTQKTGADRIDNARLDPMGFYHGMLVRAGQEQLVLCGPPVRFIDGQESQCSLFD